MWFRNLWRLRKNSVDLGSLDTAVMATCYSVTLLLCYSVTLLLCPRSFKIFNIHFGNLHVTCYSVHGHSRFSTYSSKICLLPVTAAMATFTFSICSRKSACYLLLLPWQPLHFRYALENLPVTCYC